MAITQIGQYQEVEEVERGGMAVVYRAIAPDSGQAVAIKLMLGDLLGDPRFRKRFQREAEVLQRLRHPAIVPILDHGEHNGQPYLVMPYLTGGTLANQLTRGALPPASAALLAPIAAALDAAHRQGVIHRDVKPANILFDAAFRPYLTDFGIVKLLDESTAVTQTGASLGTPGYMSPEQVRGLSLDGRCDVYALGVILFEMLTGRLPFMSTNPYAQAFQHISDPIPDARAINPALAAGWQPIIERAMAKEREMRYPTAWAIVQAAGDLIDLSAPIRPPGAAAATRPPPPPAVPAPVASARPAPPVVANAHQMPTEPLAAVGGGVAGGKAAGTAARSAGRLVIIALLMLVGLLTLGGVVWMVGGLIATAASTPTATSTSTPMTTNTPALPAFRLTRDADLRGGPGDDYPLVGQIAAGEVVTVIGRDAAGAWFNVQWDDGRGWLPRDAGELTDAAGATRVPVAGTIPPTATRPTETPTLTLTATPTPTLTPSPTRTIPPTATATRLPTPRPTLLPTPLPSSPTPTPPTEEPPDEPPPTEEPPTPPILPTPEA